MCLAIPGQVVAVSREDPEFPWATIDFGGIRKQVSLACVPAAREGDYVLVHAGLALQIVDEEEARRTRDEFAGLVAELADGDAHEAPG